MMVLQQLRFPEAEVCPAPELYFRGLDSVGPDGPARLPAGRTLGADTFFNAFSIGKWRKYTRLDNLTLTLKLSGTARVRLLHCHLEGGAVQKSVVLERAASADGPSRLELPVPGPLAEEGAYAFELTGVGDCALYGGSWGTDAAPEALNAVDIALDICTYRREAYVERNLALLRREVLDNAACELREHLDVFISDNAQTLDADKLASERVHIYKNKNTGGAGGFARGMLEIMDHPRPFTHALLMDDDVLFTADALLRTWRFLRLLRPEYAGKTLAGALMRLDQGHVQYENGAVWDGLEPRPRKENLDMRELESVLENEREERVDYNGWWYSCIPMAKVREDNLPLPLFVHRDDVEFALRTGSDIVSLNGVCVWHESFDNRYSSSMVYYETRNDLILNALRRPGFSGLAAAKLMARKLFVNVLRYRYNDCELVLRGVDDFCAGADFLMGVDAEALNREVMANAYRFEPLESLEIPFDPAQLEASLEKGKTRRVMLRAMLLNGLFLPAQGTNVVNAATCWPRCCYRKSALLHFDRITGKGFVTKRSAAKSLAALFKLTGRAFKLLVRFPAAARSYREAYGEMTSRAFWEGYLGIR